MVRLLVVKETWNSSHYPYQKCSHIFLTSFHKSVTHKLTYEIMNYFLNNFKAHNEMGDTWTLIWPNFMVHKINFITIIFLKQWLTYVDVTYQCHICWCTSRHLFIFSYQPSRIYYLSTVKQQTVHQAIH